MELANQIQAVINTLEGLNISSTYENMNKLLGCMQVLASVRDALKAPAEVDDGNDHA